MGRDFSRDPTPIIISWLRTHALALDEALDAAGVEPMCAALCESSDEIAAACPLGDSLSPNSIDCREIFGAILPDLKLIREEETEDGI